MNQKLRTPQTDKLAEAFLAMKTKEEMYSLFEDICTIAELKAMSQRLEVAGMLKDGVPYSDIVEQTGVSTATISRVNRALNYGADGYKTALKRIEK